jgi:lysozyme
MEKILRKLITMHEGKRLKPYKCSAGKLTIGIGRNLEDKGISETEAAMLLENDIKEVKTQLEQRLAYFTQLNDARKMVLIDMAFNMGINGLMRFKKTLGLIEAGNYQMASIEMLDSRWAKQVGPRAIRLKNMMATGKLPNELT